MAYLENVSDQVVFALAGLGVRVTSVDFSQIQLDIAASRLCYSGGSTRILMKMAQRLLLSLFTVLGCMACDVSHEPEKTLESWRGWRQTHRETARGTARVEARVRAVQSSVQALQAVWEAQQELARSRARGIGVAAAQARLKEALARWEAALQRVDETPNHTNYIEVDP